MAIGIGLLEEDSKITPSLKQNYIKLLDAIFSRREFKKEIISTSISSGPNDYIEPLSRYKKNRVDKKSKEMVLEAIKDVEVIEGFNITVYLRRGVKENGDLYDWNWRSSELTFWSGSDNPNSPSPLPKIEFRRLDNCIDYYLSRNISRLDLESDEDGLSRIDGNYFEWDKVNDKIDLLIKLDKVFDVSQKSLYSIQNLIRQELK
jgi:hypothetical protein